eukprot:13417943-Ditylum_brightwellii.AAC.1
MFGLSLRQIFQSLTHLGWFVDVHIILESTLIAHTILQTAIVEQNMKLNLQMATLTKDTWLPGLSSISQWEITNRIGGNLDK